ncbi:CDP-diacylglycerol--glycerol-3-phosphate 3-phosphatidyltransferase [Microcella daejeonensis]|uniref:CDP-diacylglycerol--glycerol-3-phosphate 3-phosphatidyltransferase n=1 Tax=Microcella daejeonensis TaxID=2994971 RepID=UPI0022720BF1|nr:CDP-diacylglycerol--glycerol-3-phosphate 3-phosphatidyltransferase [Microcella daejeonensis]WAB83674.1 CDP-diacylglycerol--glycerol-3-phosphate 3-phosphatidyltransferase [Microcella daejeonensis]
MTDQSSESRSFPMRGRVIRAGESPASTGNLANIITVVRILLAPVFILLLVLDAGADGPLRIAAALLFIVAIATDSLDGHLARSRNLITDLGILLDPIADKVLTGSALVMLAVLGELPWWIVVVILVREFGITLFRFAMLRDRVIPASRGGKLKTLVQSVAIGFALVPLAQWWGEWVNWLNGGLMTAAVVLTVVTGIDYLWQAWRQNRTVR